VASTTKTGRICAYCEVGTDLTNEHIFPECLYERVPSGSVTSIARTPKGDKAVDSRPTICDVCARCNNRALSKLDTYICDLHDKYFHAVVHAGDRVNFRYDLDLLLRWLLKTMYNTARSLGWNFQKDAQLLKYLVGAGLRPCGFHLYLMLVIPAPLSSVRWEVVPQDATEIPPQFCGAHSLNVHSLDGISQGYLVSLNSYYFYVFRENADISLRLRRMVLRRIEKAFPGSKELSESNRVILFSSSVDFVQHMNGNDALIAQTRLVREHLDKKKRMQ
jgi:hypothetical protein